MVLTQIKIKNYKVQLSFTNITTFFLICSRAIMMYLCNKFCTDENQHLYPTDPEERGKVDKMLFFDMGTLNYSIQEYFVSEIGSSYCKFM